MQIGNVTINGKLALAPMAGVTDLAFRHICREHGAALTVTESTRRDDGVLRVLLRSMKGEQTLHLTLAGNYTVVGDRPIGFDRGTEATLSIDGGEIWLSAGGLRIGMGMPQVKGNAALESIDFGELIALIDSGVIGKLVEVESADGDIVEITVE